MYFYILDENNEPKSVTDTLEWAQWFETAQAQRQVALTRFGGVTVSTVFLGIDHNWHRPHEPGEPVLWESMVFGNVDEFCDIQERYSSKSEALVGHEVIVERCRRAGLTVTEDTRDAETLPMVKHS